LAERRQRELDAQIEDLTRRLVEVVNRAGPEHRQDLREYAMDLLREGTEAVDAPAARPVRARQKPQNPLGLGLLLLLIGVPLSLLFAPMGIGLVAIASVMCLWGLVQVVIRR
jgi:hypothetical protein